MGLSGLLTTAHAVRNPKAKVSKRMKVARLVVLGIAIAAGGGAALLAGRSDTPPQAPPPVAVVDTVDVLVAQKDIGIGQSIAAADMRWEAWPAASANPVYLRKADHPNAVEELAGSMTRVQIASGEPLRESKLIKANGSGFMAAVLPGGMRAVSIEISAETGAGGFILPNDRVDVILSRRDKEAEKRTGIETVIGETLLTSVRALAIDQNVEEKNGQRVVLGKTATLEVTSDQAETLAAGRIKGTLSLALRSLADGSARPVAAPPVAAPRPTEAPVDTSINIVWHGLKTESCLVVSEKKELRDCMTCPTGTAACR
jgi:pilus assembly protein CpaB